MMLWTTRIDVLRPDGSGDPYEPTTTATVYADRPAHIGEPEGSDVVVGGDKELVTAVLLAPVGLDLQRVDLIDDRGTGERYRVVWCRRRQGLGLSHVRAGLAAVKGGAA
jgi:hypothetical protein